MSRSRTTKILFLSALCFLVNTGRAFEKLEIRYAVGFSAELYDHFKIVHILKPWDNAAHDYVYVLVQRGFTAPASLVEGAQVIEIPVRSVALGSGTYAPYMEKLGLSNRVVGIANGNLVFTPALAKRFQAGDIVEVATGAAESGAWNFERLAALRPELILSYGTGNPKIDMHPKLLELGFKVALDADYLESTPLGRLEWMKFIALFFNKEAQAKWAFDRIARQYNALAVKVSHVSKKPSVLLNVNFQGIWYMPGHLNYMAQFLHDAGADYLWKDSPERVLPLSAEAVLAKAGNAEFLINPGNYRSLEQMEHDDPRYRFFRSFASGNVYNAAVEPNAAGAYDYWETGLANPQQILADLIKIFHPELMPDYSLRWYKRLPLKTASK